MHKLDINQKIYLNLHKENRMIPLRINNNVLESVDRIEKEKIMEY